MTRLVVYGNIRTALEPGMSIAAGHQSELWDLLIAHHIHISQFRLPARAFGQYRPPGSGSPHQLAQFGSRPDWSPDGRRASWGLIDFQ
jgi:hypothetical protein